MTPVTPAPEIDPDPVERAVEVMCRAHQAALKDPFDAAGGMIREIVEWDELVQLMPEAARKCRDRMRAALAALASNLGTTPEGLLVSPFLADDRRKTFVAATDEYAALRADLARAEEALAFYADPETYFAIGFFPDRPCGEFIEDFDENYVHDDMDGFRPGKRARAYFAAKEAQDG